MARKAAATTFAASATPDLPADSDDEGLDEIDLEDPDLDWSGADEDSDDEPEEMQDE